MAERTVVVDSLSKSHAMTGWRVGWTVGPEAFTRHMYHLGLAMHYGMPSFIQSAVAAAFADDFPESEAMRALRGAALAGNPRLRVIRPEGACFVMLDVRPSGLSSEAFSHRLLEEAGVSLLAGEGFSAAGAGFVRLSLTAPDADLAEAIRRIESFT